MEKEIYLSLGSNLGDRTRNIDGALRRLEAAAVRLTGCSSFYETEPQDLKEQPWFLNVVVRCEARYHPLELLSVLLRIEREGGRVRTDQLKGPRSIDLDILLYGEQMMNTPELTIPHPRMLERRFVLEPLVEIAPELRHPVTKRLLSLYLKNVAQQDLRKA